MVWSKTYTPDVIADTMIAQNQALEGLQSSDILPLFRCGLRHFSDCWKHANVVILLKDADNDPLNPRSYRPVSLLSVLGKILEEIICNKLESNVGHLLNPRQNGFRPNKSTATALDEVEKWVDDKENHVIGCFLDNSGAFNNVSWSQLINDLNNIGRDDSLKALITSYLKNRTATFQIGRYRLHRYTKNDHLC